MAYKAYKYTFKLHISHNLSVSTAEQHAHTHTLKIVLYIENKKPEEFSSYDIIETTINDFLKQFEGQYLNNTPFFAKIEPTLENIGNEFYDRLKDILSVNGFDLLKLEINESPTRVFSISEKIIL